MAGLADGKESEVKELVRARGGSLERVVPVDELRVPDLWHIAMHLKERGFPKAQDEVLECWYLCHDLLRSIREENA